MLKAVDVQSFAGGFTLGVVQAGFKLMGKREQVGGFGVPNCEVNRHLLGDAWYSQACDPAEWDAVDVDLVFSNPPCSGFSLMSNKNFRGVNSPVNSCMFATIEYAARCKPEIVIFESVQQAFSGGRELMQKLRLVLEEKTGQAWNLFHVKHNALSVGGCAVRARYFWVASRIPFGIDPPRLSRLPTLKDAIGDLEGMTRTWERQPYRRPATWWQEREQTRSKAAVDGHQWREAPYVGRGLDLIREGQDWAQGMNVGRVAAAFVERTGKLPASWHMQEALLAKGFAEDGGLKMGFHQLTRWRYDKPGRVITGAALGHVLHPVEDRVITHREAARVMGFPDDWLIRPLRDRNGMALEQTWGKGITVQCGRWIADWAKRAINGTPGDSVGVEIGDREWLLDSTTDWRLKPDGSFRG